MTLIKSISGIRGTIGGKPGEGLTPLDVVRYTAAYGTLIKTNNPGKSCKIVIGRDARISGDLVSRLVTATLMGMGIDVYDLGLSTTPTTEMAVTRLVADGGIILTASHNPMQWNALKLLNGRGEFISATEGELLLKIASEENVSFAGVEELGTLSAAEDMDGYHIDAVCRLPLVDKEAIGESRFKIAIDCVNSVGGLILPRLLRALGVEDIVCLYCEPTGRFPHNPEPLPQFLAEIAATVVNEGADVGFVVDPDVDRLVVVSEDGSMFGEEYTLVAVADYVLQNTPGNTVSNLSSTAALRDVTLSYGGQYTAAPVGEVNVVEAMKLAGAVIGGEGNGGIIYPELHYGRDALVGIALFLSHLARKKMKCSELRATYPNYFNSKNKIELKPGVDVDEVIRSVKLLYTGFPVNDSDGLRIDFNREWVHLRKSNTEPIIRIISESTSAEKADELARKMILQIEALL